MPGAGFDVGEGLDIDGVHELWELVPFIYGLDGILELVMPGVGFDVGEGLDIDGVHEIWELVPFIRWSFGVNWDERHLEVVIGWDSLKIYLREKEIES